jgi:hypothetical protein
VDAKASAFDGMRVEFDTELGADGVFAGEAQAAREALEVSGRRRRSLGRTTKARRQATTAAWR